MISFQISWTFFLFCFRFFNFGLSSSDSQVDGPKITSSTLMASLKKLQLLQDRECLECGLPTTHNVLRPSSSNARLSRRNVEIMENPARNPFHLNLKNLSHRSLSMQQSEDEIQSEPDEISPELTSPELLTIYKEKDQLVTVILEDIQSLRNYFLSQMSHRTKNLAFQVWIKWLKLRQSQNVKNRIQIFFPGQTISSHHVWLSIFKWKMLQFVTQYENPFPKPIFKSSGRI